MKLRYFHLKKILLMSLRWILDDPTVSMNTIDGTEDSLSLSVASKIPALWVAQFCSQW